MATAVVSPLSPGGIRPILRHLGPLLFGRPLRGADRYAPFFIVGSGRCGTTLLRAMLEASPLLHVPPGNPMLRAVIREYRRYGRLPWSSLLQIILTHLAFHEAWEAFDLPLGPVFRDLAKAPREQRNLAAVLNSVYRARAARHKPTATRWGDKSPLAVLALKELSEVFPDLRVIHILRDGRDVAASFHDAFGDDLARATMVWLRAVQAAQAFGTRRPSQFLQVRYEDLVRDPEPVLAAVTRFVGVPFDERMLRHHEVDLRLGDVDRTSYMQGVWAPVHQRSVGRWREAFSAGEAAELERRLGPTLARLGYGGEGR